MTVPEYRELAQKAALRVGPDFLKTYAIYVVFSALLLFFSLFFLFFCKKRLAFSNVKGYIVS